MLWHPVFFYQKTACIAKGVLLCGSMPGEPFAGGFALRDVRGFLRRGNKKRGRNRPRFYD
jgi:hypothetical protein